MATTAKDGPNANFVRTLCFCCLSIPPVLQLCAALIALPVLPCHGNVCGALGNLFHNMQQPTDLNHLRT